MTDPLPLKPGSRIRIVAPSSQAERAAVEAGLARLVAMGFEPLLEPALLEQTDRYCAGTAALRLQSLRFALSEPDTPVLWALRGGYGAMHLLDGLDEAELRAAGKLLIGFSDLTALHLLWRRAGAPSIHGPNLTTLATIDAESLDHLRRLLLDDDPPTRLQGAGGYGHGELEGAVPGRGGRTTVPH